jgi:hypothetical protein
MRSRFFVTWALCGFVVAACATGSVAGDNGALPDDAGSSEGLDSGSGDAAAASLMLESGPSVFDGGPPATIGGDDSGESADAAQDDAGAAAGSDAATDAAYDAADATDANKSCGSPGGSYSYALSSGCSMIK